MCTSPPPQKAALPLLVATGITDVRDMGGRLTQIDDWRSRIAAGVIVGPQIIRVGDAAGPRLVGFSLHQEAEMVKMGMTPAEALRTATINPATYLGKQTDFGTVQAGRVANLVLLDENPLERIENTEKIFAVVLSGKLYRRSGLDRLIAEAERLALQN